MYTVQVLSNLRNYTRDLGRADMSAVFEGLNPNTVYYVTVTITIHGGASITSDPVSVKTLDGGKDSFKLLEFLDSASAENNNGDLYNIVNTCILRVWIHPHVFLPYFSYFLFFFLKRRQGIVITLYL